MTREDQPNHPESANERNLPPMGTHELFDLAYLDAMGILDEAERRRFDAGFAASQKGVKSQLREHQTLMTGILNLLPNPEVPAGQRGRVLAAIHGAKTALRLHEAGRGLPAILPSRGVSRFWRAGALGCSAAAIVLSLSLVRVMSDFRTYEQAANASLASDMFLKVFSAPFERALTSSETSFVKFVRVGGEQGAAMLTLNPESRSGHLVTRDLPSNGGPYALVVLNSDGTIGRTLVKIGSNGGRSFDSISNLDLADSAHLALVALRPDGPKIILRGVA